MTDVTVRDVEVTDPTKEPGTLPEFSHSPQSVATRLLGELKQIVIVFPF
jgi:hypothetical protein